MSPFRQKLLDGLQMPSRYTLRWRPYRVNCLSAWGIQRMSYDTPTVQVLRTVLDEVLASSSFTRQQHRSAVKVAERILWLASQGEREPDAIREHLLSKFLAHAAA